MELERKVFIRTTWSDEMSVDHLLTPLSFLVSSINASGASQVTCFWCTMTPWAKFLPEKKTIENRKKFSPAVAIDMCIYGMFYTKLSVVSFPVLIWRHFMWFVGRCMVSPTPFMTALVTVTLGWTLAAWNCPFAVRPALNLVWFIYFEKQGKKQTRSHLQPGCLMIQEQWYPTRKLNNHWTGLTSTQHEYDRTFAKLTLTNIWLHDRRLSLIDVRSKMKFCVLRSVCYHARERNRSWGIAELIRGSGISYQAHTWAPFLTRVRFHMTTFWQKREWFLRVQDLHRTVLLNFHCVLDRN